jgi:hypothetical protein
VTLDPNAPPRDGQSLTRDVLAPDAQAPVDPRDFDPFDPSRLRLPTDYAAALGVEKILNHVAVRRPDRSWFVRCHPSDDYMIDTLLIDLREDGTYLVDPLLWGALSTETAAVPRRLIASISRQGTLFLWPLRLPGPDGRTDGWMRTAMEAATLARTQWVRVSPNMAAGCYDVLAAKGQLPDPEWPTVPLAKLLRVAFQDHTISDLDHPILKKLRGEV